MSTSKVARIARGEEATFGKYHLIAKLGQGGMADVFLAVARGPAGFNKLVVIKRLKEGVGDEGDFRGMFMDEARLAARLNHPNVVQTLEVGDVDGRYYLCMEYLEGQPLNRIMNRLARSRGEKGSGDAHLPEMLRIVCDALQGLHYAHELADYDGTPLSIVHRDVSPHNVLVTYDGVAKVVDFGIAKAAVRSSYTSTGVVKGKISYMAPEQALSAPIDRRADVFSMGVILWEIVAGERLWGNLTEVQILQKMAFGDVPRLSSRKADVPPELDQICARALAMVPAERYASALELKTELERAMKALGMTATTADVGVVVAEMFRDRRAEVKAVVQEQLRGMGEDGSLPPRDVSIPDISAPTESKLAAPKAASRPSATADAAPADASQEGAASEGATADRALEATRSGIMATNTSQILKLPKRRRSPWPLVTGGVVLLGGAALVARAAMTGAGSAPAETASESTPSAAGAASGAVVPAQAALIEVKIQASPANARIFVDDVAVPANPFVAKFPGDGTGHRVRVEAPGHKPLAQLVVYDKDVSLDLTLEPEAAPTTPSSAALAAASTHPKAPPPQPAVTRPRVPRVDPDNPFKTPSKGGSAEAGKK